MKIYIAGQLDDVEAVTAAQQAVAAAGHELTHDWLGDPRFDDPYADRPQLSAEIAAADLAGAMAADAVVVLAGSEQPGRGLFVELGAALARAELGLLQHVVVVEPIVHESVFYLHPHVQRVDSVAAWLQTTR